jgi:hypothetical protein
LGVLIVLNDFLVFVFKLRERVLSQQKTFPPKRNKQLPNVRYGRIGKVVGQIILTAEKKLMAKKFEYTEGLTLTRARVEICL